MKLFCPLCCNQAFDCKKSLVEHLSSVVFNIPCPFCADKFASVELFVKHLSSDECETTISSAVQLSDELVTNGSNDLSNEGLDDSSVDGKQDCNKNDIEGQIAAHSIKLSPGVNGEVNKMYVELLSKQSLKPCIQTQELKLVMEDGENRYIVLSNEAVQNFSSENAVVTKQNNDGTISLTTAKDSKPESNSNTIPKSPEDSEEIEQTESDENQVEIYSCNTCGVSFTSVIEHIQNYHSDQDVVVAESSITNSSNSVPLELEETIEDNMEATSTITDKITVRRMITETGDIVETTLDFKDESTEESGCPPEEISDTTANKDQGKARRYVQIDKFCNSVVKNINEDDKGGPYHKVVLKELMTPTGSKVNIYNCISCNLYVPTIAEFKTRPCKILKYPCLHCPVAYENFKSLCAHMKVHKTKPDDFAKKKVVFEFECAICSTVFPTSKSLKLHKRMHDPIKSRPIDPPIETNLGTPVSEDKFLCVICNKMIPVDYKTIHQNSHKNTNKINCRICNKKFNSKEYLEMHMSVHNIDKIVVGKQDKSLPYNCVYCNRQFARPHEKVKHERIHTGEKPHSCEICGKSFRVSYCLTLHMRTHTGARPYACQHCGKRFKAHSVYNHHLLTHSEVRAYKCPFCPKAFKTSVQLAGHKNSHTKPFSCQQCNRPFASLYAVRVHMDSHAKQNSLKFSCSLCGASYARAFALKDHVRTTHEADGDAADALSGLKEEEWLVQDGDEDEESSHLQTLHRDLSDEINEIEMATVDSLVVP